jgi:hypothetical protein
MTEIFDYGVYWHSIASTLYQGGALAMALGIIVRWFAPRDWQFSGTDMGQANETLVSLLAVWSLIFAILAMLTGMFMTWGTVATRSMSLTINKSMFGTFALLALAFMLWMRFRYGGSVWNDVALKITYSLLGFIATGVAILNGSLGGEASHLGTVMVPIYSALGINPLRALVLPTGVGLTLTGIFAVALVVLIFLGLRKRNARTQNT